jgi:CheY-like chemotaxis protein
MKEESTNRPPAHRALYRILETTIPERLAWERAIDRSLVEARLDDLPVDYDDLLAFVRVYLVRHLDDGDRPWLVGSLIEDLEAEAEVARLGGDQNSSARMAAATRIPERPANTEPAPADGELISQSIPKAPALPMIASPRRPRIDRPAVLVVDHDRFGRAALSRALVQGRCDVTVLDSREEAIATIAGSDAIDVLVIDVDATGSDGVLQALVRARPEVPVLAWTNAPAAVAEHVAHVAGVRSCAVVGRSARGVDVNEALRRLLDAT